MLKGLSIMLEFNVELEVGFWWFGQQSDQLGADQAIEHGRIGWALMLDNPLGKAVGKLYVTIIANIFSLKIQSAASFIQHTYSHEH
jgi:hypothetical protein